MIEKLEKKEFEKDCGAFGNIIVERKLATEDEVQEKINELVDAVNKQQIQLNNHECRLLDLHSRITALDDLTYHEEPADPYAEQRKWIGKLCKFRDNYEDKWHFGVLEEIYERSDFPFGDFDNFEWAICEPVLPDDDIIYKGE